MTIVVKKYESTFVRSGEIGMRSPQNVTLAYYIKSNMMKSFRLCFDVPDDIAKLNR
jgi:hypothetical protein